MGASRKPGHRLKRPKIEVRMDQEEIEAVTDAALTVGESVSQYVRGAVRERVERDGFQPKGRPKKP